MKKTNYYTNQYNEPLLNFSFFSWLYALSTAVSVVSVDKLTSKINPGLILLISISLAIAYFNLININRLRNIYQKAILYLRDTIMMNIFMIGTWLSTFYGIYYLDAFAFIMFYFISSAILATANGYRYQKGIKRAQLFVSTIGLMSVLLIFIIFLQRYDHYHNVILGTILSLVGGVASFFYRKVSYQFYKKAQLSVSGILAIRSYGILLITPWVIPMSVYASLLKLPINWILLIMGVSIVTFILPVFANQKGLNKVGPERHSIIAASCPILTCVLYYLSNPHHLSHNTVFLFILAALTAFFLILPNLRFKRHSS